MAKNKNTVLCLIEYKNIQILSFELNMLPTIPGIAKQGNNIPSEKIKSTSGINNRITELPRMKSQLMLLRLSVVLLIILYLYVI